MVVLSDGQPCSKPSGSPDPVPRRDRSYCLLVWVMIEMGYCWYPEYTVEEQFRDFNQSQYLCTVRIFPSYPGSTEPLHCSYGLGVTVEMVVQDAAYSMMTIMRVRTGLLRNTDFRYMPASLPGAQGYLQAIYADSTQEDSLTRTTAELLYYEIRRI